MTVNFAPIFAPISTMTKLTLREASSRRLLWIGVGLGLAFLVLYGIGLHYLMRDIERTMPQASSIATLQKSFASTMLTMAMFVANFLVIVTTLLSAVGSVSGELSTDTIHAIAAKPLHRWQIILGKWLGYAIMVTLFSMLLTGGIMLVTYLLSGFEPYNPPGIMAVMALQGLATLSLTIFGSAIMPTLANGITVFMLYSLAYIGGTMEQIGAEFGSEVVVNIGIISSLIMPAEALWRYGSNLMLPPGFSGLLGAFGPGGFGASQPNTVFLVYAGLYTLGLLAGAVLVFNRRDL